ncbi:TlpA family protein disulfide reductase [Mesonia aestuariivivens]|uniref:TlpA family protein disulfide reductase n=1 Tax=Mesonia aestuariivivens TaxID=2796128 RepID=A0ABS6W0D3_9FLAO|nr:TlpA disulfide reductase family protein [Mesonia aestuariivivens]MBW2961022.1 TlpA family protein disulfide reductase [Mesonia aestuariivivens]
MRKIILFTFLLINLISYSQNKTIEKPSYIYIANDELISEEALDSLVQNGKVISLKKGVSQEKRDQLAKKHQGKIGDKEFIIIISTHTSQKNTKRQEIKIDNNDYTQFSFENQGNKLQVGDQTEDFTVTLTSGEKITLSNLKGKVVLLNFWATWCAPCLMELYEFPKQIFKPYKNENFVFLAISRGEEKEKVINKLIQLKQKGIDFESGLDPNKKIWNKYATKYIPKNFVIDKNGVIQFISTGNTEGNVKKISKTISKLLKE